MENGNRPDFIKRIEEDHNNFYFEKSSRLAKAVAEACDMFINNPLHATGLSAMMYEKLKICLLTEVEIQKKRISDYEANSRLRDKK